jgi:DNA-binding CsgD family transcriptional regulator
MSQGRDSNNHDDGGVRVSEFSLGGIEFVVASFPTANGESLQLLSAAEREVALLAAGGCPSREIASRRGTSERTVANQLASIFKKLGLTSRAELARVLTGGRV